MGLIPTSTIRDQVQSPAAAPPGGIFQRLLADPMRMQLLLSGIGLMGAKRQSQADRYYGGIQGALGGLAQKPIQQAQIENLGADTEYKRAQAQAEGATDGPWSGSGSTAGALRIVAEADAKMRQGLPLTVAETARLDAARAFLSQPQIGFTPGGQQYRTPGMDLSYLGGGQQPQAPQQPGPGIPGAGMPPQMPGGQPPMQGRPPQQVPPLAQVPQQPQIPQQPTFPQTPAQISVDQKMADEYVKWTSGGGYSDMKKNLSQLQSALFNLESGKVETGDWKAFVSSLAPDKWVSYLRPDFMDTREKVEEVAQRNLKEVLGAQFAKIEGEQLIKRAYNPNISTELNAERVRRLMKQITEAAEAKQAAMEFYAANGSMVGYAPNINSLSDLEAELAKGFEEKKLWGDMKDQDGGAQGGGASYYDPISGTWSDQ